MKNITGPAGTQNDIIKKPVTRYALLNYSNLFLAESELEKQLFSGKVSIKDYLKNRKLLKQILQD
jgi:hypothetical protein